VRPFTGERGGFGQNGRTMCVPARAEKFPKPIKERIIPQIYEKECIVMSFEAKAWKETEGPFLKDFNEKEAIDSVNGALALRPQIEKVIDQIWDNGFDGIYFIGIGGTYASSMQVEVYMRGRSKLPVFVENAAEFLTTGNKRFTDKSVVIYSSVSGNTKEMVQLVDRVHEIGAKVFAFIDTPGTTLTAPDKQDYLIMYPKNEQLKFYMVANYLMYKNGEFPQYEAYNKEMEAHLAQVLVDVEKEADAWAYEYAKNKVAFLADHPDLPHYFIGSGNQYGATYSYAMCYWEEQMWIRTKSISCQEFFHGMQEIIVADTPVTLFMGEDEQRPLAERVAKFLPKVCANYTVIDTKELELKGISEENRGSISHLVMHGVNNRVDAYMELFLRHPLSIRRYYRQFDY
jgi:fructoselysine-6-phosphate deglycase